MSAIRDFSASAACRDYVAGGVNGAANQSSKGDGAVRQGDAPTGVTQAGPTLQAGVLPPKATMAADSRAGARDQAPVLLAIRISPTDITIVGEKTLAFTAEGLYSAGDPTNETNAVQWESNNSLVTINDYTGAAFTINATGMAIITATSKKDPKVAGQTSVRLTKENKPNPNRQLRVIKVEPYRHSMVVGMTQPFKATFQYSDLSEDETEAVDWVSAEPAALSIDDKGVATALRAADRAIVIKATPKRKNGWEGSAAVTVTTKPELLTVAIRPAVTTIVPGGGKRFQLMGQFSDNSEAPLDGDVSWSSDTPDTVFIDNRGEALGRKSGKATLTAVYKTAGFSGSDKAWVNVPFLESITITPVYAAVLVGDKLQFSAIGHYAGNVKLPLGDKVTWSCKPEILRIDNHGNFTALKAGSNAIVLAQHIDEPSITGAIGITVTSPVLQLLEIEAVNASYFKGSIAPSDRVQFRAVGVYSGGTRAPMTDRGVAEILWSTDKPQFLKVDENGVAVAVAVGDATITVKHAGGAVAPAQIKVRVSKDDRQRGTPPADVLKPYDDGKSKYTEMHDKVRQLDGVPKMILALSAIVADISKNAKPDAVTKAIDTETALQLYQSVNLQLTSFQDSVGEAHELISQSNLALKIHKDDEKVKDLLKKGEKEEKNIKFFTGILAGFIKKAVHHGPAGPIEAAFEGLSALVERYQQSAFISDAEELDNQVQKDKLAYLNTQYARAAKKLHAANGFLMEAKQLVAGVQDNIQDHLENTENDFDDHTKGAFKFADLTRPLTIADEIVDKLVPETLTLAATASAAITKHLQSDSKESVVAPILHDMAKDAFLWRTQADIIGKETAAKRQNLRDMRARALHALAKVKPPRHKK